MIVIEWLATLISIAGAWLVGSSKINQRLLGFILFLISNGLWIWFAYDKAAYGMLLTQIVFCITSARGLWNSRTSS